MADSSLTDFQKEKILRVFHLLYDTNQDGMIKKEDFGLAVEKVCKILDWTKGGKEYSEAEETLNLIWEGLKKYADENQDDKVSEDEWLKMWTESVKDIKSGKEFPEWQKKFVDFMFKVNDKSGDNEIDENEFSTVYQAYGISKDNCSTAFKKISGGKNITKPEFEALWKEYFVSNDRASKGNYLFGVPDFI
ncbi:sarcoplasmic calcium-binding proteins I, III, and IV-like [Mytilus galloprovincialis]|uniref:sarcoplasmic calcium-binding proteins I, III, and IV-like n=1 Tax=Mytilus galloprovincialis TaxID=29158 RepID=UPI003F7BE673